MDPVSAAKQSEEAGRLPFIAVIEFRVEYDPQPDGSMKESEWVKWAKKGVSNPATTDENIARLKKYPDNLIWQVIKPSYERWKAGLESPVDGTPLAAWPGATPQLVKALAPANIRSVEDLAQMEDSAISKLAIQNLRKLRQNARAFLEAQKSTAQVSGEVVKLRNENEALKARVDELIKAVEAITEDDAPEKPRRGRPPKAA
jgi:hypothetical protein